MQTSAVNFRTATVCQPTIKGESKLTTTSGTLNITSALSGKGRRASATARSTHASSIPSQFPHLEAVAG